MFNRFYRFGSKSKVKFYFHLIYGILGLHLTVYAVGLARHEFAIFLLNSQITNITTLSEGKNPNLALQGIPRLQKKLPVEPKIYNIITSIKSLFPCFDDYNLGAYQELSYLLAHHKDSLKNLNLNGFTFLGLSDDPEAGNFKYSDFQNVKLY